VSFQKHNALLLSPSPGRAEAQEAPLAFLVAVSGRGGEGQGRTEDADFFQTLLPSFMATTAPGDGFDYTFYIAFDVGDPFYDSPERRADFERLFLRRVGQHPLDQSILGAVLGSSALRRRAKLRWVSVAPYADGQTGPVRAWNVAFQEAFSDGAAYFYQLGEDVRLATPGWASKLVGQLRKQGDVGIAGGREMNYQADSELMPCVMVPRAHMSIFGTFFPTKLHNWWSDDWILQAYKPFGLAAHVPTVEIENTNSALRYEVSQTDMWVSEELEESSQRQISKYLQLLGQGHAESPQAVTADPGDTNMTKPASTASDVASEAKSQIKSTLPQNKSTVQTLTARSEEADGDATSFTFGHRIKYRFKHVSSKYPNFFFYLLCSFTGVMTLVLGLCWWTAVAAAASWEKEDKALRERWCSLHDVGYPKCVR